MTGVNFPRFTARPTPLDLTPLVDVVLTLVLFFILTSSFVLPYGVTVDIPEVTQAEKVPGSVFEVQILKGDRIVSRDGRTMTPEQFRKEAETLARSGRPVLITGDRAASLGRTLEVWDACREAGVKQLHIRTEGPEGPAAPR
jgi:biopolymer transport protein ExbD